MNITNFLAIGIVGIIASLIVEGITRIAKSSPIEAKAIAVATCLVLGTGYYFAAQTVWWTTVVAVLGVASTVYALIFNSNSISAPTLPPV